VGDFCISYNMVQSLLIPGLPEEIVAEHIMPKVMEPIMAVNPVGPAIPRALLKADFFALLCIYKYMGVNKVWRLHFRMGEVYNAFRLALFDEEVYFGHNFVGVIGTRLLDKVMRTFYRNKNIFSTTQRISIPIRWQVQHAHLNDIWIMELEYLRDKLVDNKDYWSRIDGRSIEFRRCTNFWICPSERLLTL